MHSGEMVPSSSALLIILNAMRSFTLPQQNSFRFLALNLSDIAVTKMLR